MFLKCLYRYIKRIIYDIFRNLKLYILKKIIANIIININNRNNNNK